jgi:hypothetical protein
MRKIRAIREATIKGIPSASAGIEEAVAPGE